jgi:hypothetical protein
MKATVSAADAAGSTTAGLAESGSWHQWRLARWQYVLQNGLNLGQQYTIANYPSSINPATDGLRNLTGKVNADGTVTIWAVYVHRKRQRRPGRRPEHCWFPSPTRWPTPPPPAPPARNSPS